MRPLLSIVFALTAAPACVADDAEKHLKPLQGDWQMVSLTSRGKSAPEKDLKGKIWRFEGDKLIPLDNKDDVATVKKPATLDITDKGAAVNRCIYKIEGDKLTLCVGKGDERPTEFTAADGKGWSLVVFERVKK
jgi:uncharacterized protein (TIGR03067 family)